MATKNAPDFTIVSNKAAKSAVWTHFGFVKQNEELDKKKVACRLCYSVLKYSGNTTNLTHHLKRKHPTVSVSKSTETFHSIFGPTKLPSSSRRAREITSAMAQFIVKDLRPYVVVENEGFKNLIKVLEPKYSIPSRQHFSEKVIPELYTKVSTQVKQDLKSSYVAITTDGWTSRATESYVTITSSHIDENWNLKKLCPSGKSQ